MNILQSTAIEHSGFGNFFLYFNLNRIVNLV